MPTGVMSAEAVPAGAVPAGAVSTVMRLGLSGRDRAAGANNGQEDGKNMLFHDFLDIFGWLGPGLPSVFFSSPKCLPGSLVGRGEIGRLRGKLPLREHLTFWLCQWRKCMQMFG